jgi:hypothetical protein
VPDNAATNRMSFFIGIFLLACSQSIGSRKCLF